MKQLQPFLEDLKEFQFPLSNVSYKHLAYLATALTGFASLCAQVAWQKYLAILVGSETRSINLVVAVFLLGLAAGYYVFGKITEKKWTRYKLLKLYAYVELGTAVYIFSFPFYFHILKTLSFNSPAHLLSDIFISFLALFPPTFLMGASIPALTSTLPEESKDINAAHVQIYGWNTFGAFGGVLISGFCLLPLFGLPITLVIAGALNLIAALIFMGNRLEGQVHRQKDFPFVPSKTPNWFYMLCAFLTGAIVISFEILFIRLVNISLGAGVYNFPIILSLFVGGLALGSLSVKFHKISAAFFIKQILITAILLGFLYFTSPYWSIWLSHIRVSLFSIPSNYFVFKAAAYLFLFLFLFPFVFFMGRLLPLTYVLLKKNDQNYGFLCGLLYFLNTLGTVVGAIVIGYLAFYIFNLDDLFKMNLFLLIILSLLAAVYEKKTLSLCLSFFLIASIYLLPIWNRTGHYLGYFRTKTPPSHYFQKLFFLPKKYKTGDVISFTDGPNVSASLIGYKSKSVTKEARDLIPSGKYSSVSFVVNGKAIGNTIGDFPTMFLLSALGYLYAPEREEGFDSAVIGLGMGISAGVMGAIEKSREVIVLEIAQEVIDNVKKAPAFNFGVADNPKVKMIAQDGFKYFTRSKKKFDLIVSQPSNPWIVGVENVFSYEFYKMVKSSLFEDGVLVQWAQLYSVDAKTLKIMFHTLKKVFPHAKLYKAGSQDIVIVASQKPLSKKHLKERFFEPGLTPYYNAIGFYEPEDISLVEIFSEDLFSKIASNSSFGVHTLEFPKLAYRGDKTFFTGRKVNPENLTPEYLFDTLETEEKKIKAFKKHSSLSNKEIKEKCIKDVSFLCRILIQDLSHKTVFENKTNSLSTRLKSYIFLRKRGRIKHDASFLESIKEDLLKKAKTPWPHNQTIVRYFSQILSQKQYEKAEKDFILFREKGLMEKGSDSVFKKHIEFVKKETSY